MVEDAVTGGRRRRRDRQCGSARAYRDATDPLLDKAKAEREGRSVEEVEKASTSSIPAGRYGEPDEYGSVVAFLAGTGASYITGSVIRVDGGLIPSI